MDGMGSTEVLLFPNEIAVAINLTANELEN